MFCGGVQQRREFGGGGDCGLLQKDMLACIDRSQCLLVVGTVRAGDVDGVDIVRPQHRVQVGPGDVGAEGGRGLLSGFRTAGVDPGQRDLRNLVHGIDELVGDPAGADRGNTNHD